MFEEVIREIRRMNRDGQITVSIETDSDGYIDQVCPSPQCEFGFKVHMEDRDEKINDGVMFCPRCGHKDDAQEWFPSEQQQYFEKAAYAHIGRKINRAMRTDARRFNQKQPKDGFIRMTLSVGGQPLPIALPPAAAEPMQMKAICSKCFCRYAVVGAAFFCPACGHNDIKQMFYSSLNRCRGTLDQIPKLPTEVSDRDATKNATDVFIEHALLNAVTAFQKYAEDLYQDLLKISEIPQNGFQRLIEGSTLWHSATGKQYSDYISGAELATLTLAFQQRHLFAHNNGIVDQKYLDRSGDTSYQLGQRIVLQEKRVREYIYLVRKLASCMEETAQENKAGL